MNQWHEPDEGIATFRLVFPPWGIQLNEDQREQSKSTWAKTDIFIEGHHEYLTVVSFYIVRENATLQKRGEFPGFQLGELVLKVGKKLAITAEWEPERGSKTNIENALRRSPPEKNLFQDHLGQTLAACVTGHCGASTSVYLVHFPVIYSNPSPQEQIRSKIILFSKRRPRPDREHRRGAGSRRVALQRHEIKMLRLEPFISYAARMSCYLSIAV